MFRFCNPIIRSFAVSAVFSVVPWHVGQEFVGGSATLAVRIRHLFQPEVTSLSEFLGLLQQDDEHGALVRSQYGHHRLRDGLGTRPLDFTFIALRRKLVAATKPGLSRCQVASARILQPFGRQPRWPDAFRQPQKADPPQNRCHCFDKSFGNVPLAALLTRATPPLPLQLRLQNIQRIRLKIKTSRPPTWRGLICLVVEAISTLWWTLSNTTAKASR